MKYSPITTSVNVTVTFSTVAVCLARRRYCCILTPKYVSLSFLLGSINNSAVPLNRTCLLLHYLQRVTFFPTYFFFFSFAIGRMGFSNGYR